jgi:hypothetical protein
MNKIHYTKESFGELISKRLEQIKSQFERDADYYRITNSDLANKFAQLPIPSVDEIMNEIEFEPCSLYPQVAEIFVQGISIDRWDRLIEYPDIFFPDEYFPGGMWKQFEKIDEIGIQVMEKMATGDYCTAWFCHKENGTTEKKMLEVAAKRDYWLYSSVQEYEKALDEAISRGLEGCDWDDHEYLRGEMLEKAQDHAIYLKNGMVAFILLPIDEAIEI